MFGFSALNFSTTWLKTSRAKPPSQLEKRSSTISPDAAGLAATFAASGAAVAVPPCSEHESADDSTIIKTNSNAIRFIFFLL
jgi:hypothetical protein